jgi:hypothetical protein
VSDIAEFREDEDENERDEYERLDHTVSGIAEEYFLFELKGSFSFWWFHLRL